MTCLKIVLKLTEHVLYCYSENNPPSKNTSNRYIYNTAQILQIALVEDPAQ